MNWRGTLARIKWSFNLVGRIRFEERERCIRVLCSTPLPEVTATTRNGNLDEQWIRALVTPHGLED